MSSGAPRARSVAAPLGAAAVAAVATYAAMLAIYELFRADPSSRSLWWPVTAAVVVVMLRCPRRWWAWIVGGFVVGVVAANVPVLPLSMTVTLAVADTAEVAIAVFVFADWLRIEGVRVPELRDALRFAVATLAAVAAGSVIVGLCWLLFIGAAMSEGLFVSYVVTHVLGFLTVAPLLLPKQSRPRRRPAVVEVGAVLLAVTLLAWWALLQPNSDGRAFIMLLPVMWAAVRFDAARATAVSALTCVIAAFATAHERGPMASSGIAERRDLLVYLFMFAVTAATIGLVLVTRHRIQLAAQARESEQTLRIAIRDALIGMYSIRLDPERFGEIRDVNNALCDLLGYRGDELIGRHCGVLGAAGRPDEMALLRRHLERFADRSMTSLREESTFRTTAGEERWVELNLSVVEAISEPAFLLVHVHDLTDRVRAQRSLEKMALHDPLTGLANRTLLFRRIGLELAGARDAGVDGPVGDLAAARAASLGSVPDAAPPRVVESAGEPWAPVAGVPGAVGLMYLDLDGFKQVNDTYGHDAGDAVLIAVARRIQGAVRGDSTVARLGGDEFAVLCPAVQSEAELGPVAERIRDVLRQPIHLDGSDGDGERIVSIDVSIGFGTVSGSDTADDLVRAADQAMYAVKEARRAVPPQRRVEV